MLQNSAVLFLAISSCYVRCQQPTVEPEFKLIDTLLSNYPLSNGGRPVEKYDDVVNVSLTLTPLHLGHIDLSPAKQTASLMAELKLQWRDPFLDWSQMGPAFQSIRRVTLKPQYIWTPQILLSNNGADDNQQIVTTRFGEKSHAIVEQDGIVTWTLAGLLVAKFTAKLANFPFDQQAFSIDLESWLDQTQLRFSGANMDTTFLGNFSGSGNVWSLKGYDMCLRQSGGSTSGGAVASFQLNVSRNPKFHLFTMVAPLIFFSVLHLAAFGLQIDEPDRAVFSITVLLGFGIFQIMVKNEIPKTSEPVLLLVYILVEFCIGTISTIHSTILCYIATKADQRQFERIRNPAPRSRIYPAQSATNLDNLQVVSAESRLRTLGIIDKVVFLLLLVATLGIHVGIYYYNMYL